MLVIQLACLVKVKPHPSCRSRIPSWSQGPSFEKPIHDPSLPGEEGIAMKTIGAPFMSAESILHHEFD